MPKHNEAKPEKLGNCGWQLDQAVEVELHQWIPPLDSEGEWKPTGKGFRGVLTNGPDSRLHPEGGRFWYVLPDDGGVHGVLAPVQISEDSFDPYGQIGIISGEVDPKAGTELLRFVVNAIHVSQSDAALSRVA